MSETKDLSKPTPNDEKFKPRNVAGSKTDKGRPDREMLDVARGSEGDRRRNSQNRKSDRG